MRCASVKKLLEAFPQLDSRKAELIRALAHAVSEPSRLSSVINGNEDCKATVEYVRAMHSDPYESQMWRTTIALHAIDCVLGTHGVEPLGEVRMQGPPYEYCNTGDPYTTTLIYKRATDSLFIGCWGDIVEREGL